MSACVETSDIETTDEQAVAIISPDYTISALSSSAEGTSVQTGGTITIDDTTANVGTIDANVDTVTQFYFSTTQSRAGIVAEAGRRTVAPLAAGTSSSVSATYTVPAVPAGAYYILACANASNSINEGNLGNQCRATAGTVDSSGANLVETGVSNPPQRANVRGTFSISEGVLNNGSAATNTGSTTYFYLSVDGISPSSTVAGSRTTGTIGAGSTSSGSTTLLVPSGTAKGTYKILACADRLNQVAELDEHDNCTASTASIAINGPDLLVSSVTVSAITTTTFNVTDKTSSPVNVAVAPASSTGFFLSTDATKSSDDLAIHDCSVSGVRSVRAVPSLSAGQSNTATTTLPKCYSDSTGVHPLPTGSFRILACADAPDAIGELNEGNNCRASAAVTF
jgi:hypothetical protein